MKTCYYCQHPIVEVRGNCDYHQVQVLHQWGNGNKLNGLALATAQYEVYMNFEDKTCEIYIKGRFFKKMDHIPRFTPDNMIDKVKTYLIFS